MDELDSTLGIDFGTTNTTIFYRNHGRVTQLEIDKNRNLLRSAVSYTDKGVFCGESAIAKATKADLHVLSVKRILGVKSTDDEEIENDIYGCKLRRDNNGEYQFFNPYSTSTLCKSPIEVATDIFKYIKSEAEKKEHHEFNNVFLSYPSTFQMNQRSALRKAAENAGFSILGMITEPTAAGVHYREKEWIKEKDVVLVFDFGGGTLDLSLMVYEDNAFNIFASGGNGRLGGNDVDLLILNYLEGEYRKRCNSELLNKGNERHYYTERNKILKEIEIQKKILQQPGIDYVEIDVDEYNEISIGLTNEKLEELLENMKSKILASLKRLSEQIVRYYKGGKIGKYRITSSHNLLQKIVDSVIMVGGSSNLKFVQKLLTSYFPRDIVHKNTDLQECVGSGVFYSYLSLNNPELTIREVLYCSIIVHIGDKEYRIDNGTTIPFQVTYSCQVDPFEPSVHVKIEEEPDTVGKENRLVLIDEVMDDKYLPDFDSNQIGLQLVLNLDCLLTISLVDYSNGESMIIKKCEMLNVY